MPNKRIDVNHFISKKAIKQEAVDFFEIKYKPNKSSLIVGNKNKEIVQQLNEYVNNVNGRVVFIHGPTGCGKGLITNLIIKENNFNPIFFDVNDTHKKKDFIERIDYLLTLHKNKQVSIVIKNIDNALGESAFSKFLKVIKQHDVPFPIFLISSSRKLAKSYNKSMILFIHMDYPEKEPFIQFCKHICKKESLKINLPSIRYIIQFYHCHYRKILQTFKLISLSNTLKQKQRIVLHDIKNILEVSKTDTFYCSAELIQKIFTDTNIDLESIVRQTFVLDLFYSNMPYIKDLLFFSQLIDTIGTADHIEHTMFKIQSWILKHYSILLCVLLLNSFLKQEKKTKKFYLKKNMLNNLSSVRLKNRNKTFVHIPTRFKLKYYEYNYIDKYIKKNES